jgi:hypothetical protein
MKKKATANGEYLLELHRQHLGLYSRAAKKFSVDPSYVSRVANGTRENEQIKTYLINELAKLAKSRAEG